MKVLPTHPSRVTLNHEVIYLHNEGNYPRSPIARVRDFEGAKERYRSKDFVYYFTKKSHIQKFNVGKVYQGLAANRPLEISHLLGTNEIHSFMRKREEFLKLQEWLEKYPLKGDVSTHLYNEDILMSDIEKDTNVLDLDFFSHLDKNLVFSVLGKMKCLSDVATVLVWHSTARFKGGLSRIDRNRKIMLDLISRQWQILRYDKVSYSDSTAMAVEILTLERKQGMTKVTDLTDTQIAAINHARKKFVEKVGLQRAAQVELITVGFYSSKEIASMTHSTPQKIAGVKMRLTKGSYRPFVFKKNKEDKRYYGSCHYPPTEE